MLISGPDLEQINQLLYLSKFCKPKRNCRVAANAAFDVSVTLGVNNYDHVVGYTYLPVFGEMPIQQVAFLWRRNVNGGGQMINLNRLLYGNGKNYLVFSATAINDNGQIVGTAYDLRDGNVRAVLLTPTGPVRR